jgi:hypothetical protein
MTTDEKMDPPAGALGLLAGLAMFQPETDEGEGDQPSRRSSLPTSTRRIIDDAQASDDAQGDAQSDAQGDEAPARPGQPTRRQDVAERAAEIQARSAALATEAESFLTPCERARTRSKEFIRLARKCQDMFLEIEKQLLSYARGTSHIGDKKHEKLIERMNELDEQIMDALSS